MSGDESFFLVEEDRAFSWLKGAALQKLFALLNRDGEEVRVVGGAVRNALMNEPVSDIDCATTADPGLVMNWARAAGIRVLPTGLDHGTLTLLVDDQPFEVTTLRADVETDGRHAKVVFGRDWTQDAMRRDFTMNALYLDEQGRLYDPTHRGIADAKTRFIRFIGDADQRIAEDYLRVLRYFRFRAQYGQYFKDEDYRACLAAQHHLGDLSGERVGAEMTKLLTGKRVIATLQAMHEGGMLPALLRGVPRLTRFARLLHLASVLRLKPDLVLLLATLCVEVHEDSFRVAEAWRLPNRQRDGMVRLARTVRGIRGISEAEMQKLAYIHGKDLAVDLVLLALVRRQIRPDLTALSMMMRNLDLWNMPLFPISGRDLLDSGMKPGPRVGEMIAILERMWIDSGFEMTRGQLLARKRQLLCGTYPMPHS